MEELEQGPGQAVSIWALVSSERVEGYGATPQLAAEDAHMRCAHDHQDEEDVAPLENWLRSTFDDCVFIYLTVHASPQRARAALIALTEDRPNDPSWIESLSRWAVP